MIDLKRLHSSQRWYLACALILGFHYILDIAFGRFNVQDNPYALTIRSVILAVLIFSMWAQTLGPRIAVPVAALALSAIFVLEIWTYVPAQDGEEFVFRWIYCAILATTIVWLVYDHLRSGT